MSNAFRNILIAVLGVVLISFAMYGCVALYYYGGFSYGTVVNGVDITGMSVEEANKELVKLNQYDEISVVDKNGESYLIPMNTIAYQTDYTDSLNKYMETHSGFSWGSNFIQHNINEFQPVISFDRGLLEMQLNNAPFMASSPVYNENNTIEIILTDTEGYQIQDDTKDMLHPDRVYDVVEDAIFKSAAVCNLADEGCYESIDNPELENQVKTLFGKISDFQSFKLTYDMGDTEEVVDSSVTSSWIAVDDFGNFLTDEDGNLILDENSVKEYVASLAAKYDTKNMDRTFKSTSGKIIEFPSNKVLYGTTIDQTAECKALLENIRNGESGITREPKYLSKAFARGADDVGNTYIEINLTEQHLYYYKDGELFMESDFVSGNMARGTSTPQLFAYVRNKATNVTLRGVDYESFVYYWMGIWQGYGMHDATWRAKFGGNIYKTNGSHGCVNLPLNFIKQFYPEVEVGTPLIMFYEPEPTKEETEAADKARDEARARADAAERQRAAQKAAAEAAQQAANEQAALEALLKQQAEQQAQQNNDDGGGDNGGGDNGGGDNGGGDNGGNVEPTPQPENTEPVETPTEPEIPPAEIQAPDSGATEAPAPEVTE